MLAPIVLFVYNRPKHTRQTIEALKRNKLASQSELFIFSDAPKSEDVNEDVQEVREYIRTITAFKNITIKEAKENKGLANSIISGITEVIRKYGKVIVLEDDLITSPNFLEYMNRALDFYEENQKIWSISAYNLPIEIPKGYNKDVYLSYRASSWGWATWKDRWKKNDWSVSDYIHFLKNKEEQKLFNRGGDDMTEMLKSQIDGKIDSWAIRWCYSQFRDNSYTIYPVKSKVQNIGNDGSGVHCGNTDISYVELDDGSSRTNFSDDLEENKIILRRFKKHYDPRTFKGKIGKLLKKIGLYESVKQVLGR
ncbi:glycosyltransferase [Orenia marismortui]|uniref:glycosyltransferase n=1 Tax=Orenia marismortui TaxID=46469 RepID=UPI000364F89C|nr:glycosyltransferase [Orenia marismortui]